MGQWTNGRTLELLVVTLARDDERRAVHNLVDEPVRCINAHTRKSKPTMLQVLRFAYGRGACLPGASLNVLDEPVYALERLPVLGLPPDVVVPRRVAPDLPHLCLNELVLGGIVLKHGLENRVHLGRKLSLCGNGSRYGKGESTMRDKLACEHVEYRRGREADVGGYLLQLALKVGVEPDVERARCHGVLQ